MPPSLTQRMPTIYKPMPLRFLWPTAIVVSLVIGLWSQFPWHLRVSPVQPSARVYRSFPRVAYVAIDDASINQLVKRAASAWMLGSGSGAKKRLLGLDLATLEASLKPPAPVYLDNGSIIPSTWRAEKVSSIPLNIPLIPAPEKVGLSSPSKILPHRDTFKTRLSSSLRVAAFTFPFSVNTLKPDAPSSGQCRFYIECNAAGDVEHVLRLSHTTLDVSVFERALMLGKAKTLASGWIDIEWMIRK